MTDRANDTTRRAYAKSVLLVPSSFPPHIGGVEEVTMQLARGLQSRGVRTEVLTNRWPKDLLRDDVIDGVAVHREVFRVPEPNPRQFGGWALTSAATTQRIVARARRTRPEIVNVHCVSSNGRYALGLHRRLGTPLVVSLHGELSGDASGVYARSSQLRRSFERLIRAASAVTAPSQFTLDQAAAFLGSALPSLARVIPNGVNPARQPAATPSPDGARYVLGVGRLVGIKGFDLLLRAFARLPADLAHHLTLIGDGPERESLLALAKELNLADRLQILGALPHPETQEWIGRAAAVVIASRSESLPLVMLEAMAAGTPVVSTNVGGISEVLSNGDNGLLVPAEDVSALHDGLSTLLRNRTLQERLGLGGRHTAAELSWSRCVDAYEDLYRDVLS